MKYKIEITLSKIFAYMITIMAFILTILLKEVSIFITIVTIAAGLIVNKQINDRLKTNKEDGK